jgi:hypothetical protein
MSRAAAVDFTTADLDPDTSSEEQLKLRAEAFREAAEVVARAEVADAVTGALQLDGRSLRQIQRETGIDPAFLSKLANGRSKTGGTVASLALVALALNKTLRISIED